MSANLPNSDTNNPYSIDKYDTIIVSGNFKAQLLTDDNAEEIASWTGGTVIYAQGLFGVRCVHYLAVSGSRITPGNYVVQFNEHAYFGLSYWVAQEIMKEV